MEKQYDKIAAQLNNALYAVTKLIGDINKTLDKGTKGQHGVVITSDDARLVILKGSLQVAYRHIYEAERRMLMGWEEAEDNAPLPCHDKAEAKNLFNMGDA